MRAAGRSVRQRRGDRPDEVDALRSWRRPKQPYGNPWQSGTLEWLSSENYGARSIEQVESREPLWTRPGLAAEVEAGRHWLPGTVTGQRETIVTSPRQALPRHVLVLPGDGWLPLVAGLGTAGFFLLLTVKLILPAIAFGVLGLVSTLAWLWGSDRPAGVAQAQVAERVSLPIGARGVQSHSWWAMVVLVVVDATIFASLAFAHLHVSLLATVCPPPGSRLPASGWVSSELALWAVAAVAIWGAGRFNPARPTSRSRWAMTALVAAALAAAAAAWAVGGLGHADAALSPRVNAWSATVGTLLAWQAFHVAVLAVMAAYLLARLWRGHLLAHQRATLDNVTLFWLYTMLQGVVGTLFVHWLPGWLN